MWGESNPGDMDAMLLLSCLPVEVASRNRMVRKIMVDDIRFDPGWNNGNYTEQPYGLRAALGHLLVVLVPRVKCEETTVVAEVECARSVQEPGDIPHAGAGWSPDAMHVVEHELDPAGRSAPARVFGFAAHGETLDIALDAPVRVL